MPPEQYNEFQDSAFNLRHQPKDTCEIGSDIWQQHTNLVSKVAELERTMRLIATSFPQNDLGQPGYEDHRKEHLQSRKTNEVLEGYKINTTTAILKALGVFIAGAISPGLIEAIKRLL